MVVGRGSFAERDATGDAQRVSLAKIVRYYRTHLAINAKRIGRDDCLFELWHIGVTDPGAGGEQLAMQQRLFDFLDEVKPLTVANEVGWRFIALAQDQGALGVHIWFADGTTEDPAAINASATTYTPETVHALNAVYKRMKIAKWVARGGLPIRLGWEVESRLFDKGTLDHRVASAQMHYDRRRNSVIAPLPTRGKYGTSGVSVYQDAPAEAFDKWVDERGSLLIHAAAAAHLTMQARERAAAEFHLSPRELECIKWLSTGLRTKEIAWKLGLSTSAIMLYINNARRKMKVATRQALVAKAYMVGLIS